MNLTRVVLITVSAFLFTPLTGVAQETVERFEDIKSQILNQLRQARPDLEFGSVAPSPLLGYYEVSIDNRQTVYVSEDGKHFFTGELYFAKPGELVNATEMTRSKERKQVLAGLSESDMIIYKPEGETKAVLNVFTDVTCGYCRKLHGQVAEMNDLGIEVRYLAYPRTGIRRNGELTSSYIETAKAWCAKDRQAAMTKLKQGQDVPVQNCDNNPLEEQYLLGQKFGVTGTPAIVLADGSLVPGYRSAQAYAELLGVAAE